MASAAPFPPNRPPQYPPHYPWPPPGPPAGAWGPGPYPQAYGPGRGPVPAGPPPAHAATWAAGPRYQPPMHGQVPWIPGHVGPPPPKHGPKPAPPEYFAVELKDNPLGLSNMHIKNETTTQPPDENAPPVPAPPVDDYIRRTGPSNPRIAQPDRPNWQPYTAVTWDRPLPHAEPPKQQTSRPQRPPESSSSSSSGEDESDDLYSDEDSLDEQYLRGTHSTERERQRDRHKVKEARRSQPPDHVRVREIQREQDQRDRGQRERERERERLNQRQMTHGAEVTQATHAQAGAPVASAPPPVPAGWAPPQPQASPSNQAQASTRSSPMATPQHQAASTSTGLSVPGSAAAPNGLKQQESFTAHRALQPTFSPRIVRTPTHYEQKKRMTTPATSSQSLQPAPPMRHATEPQPSSYSHSRSSSESAGASAGYTSPPHSSSRPSIYGPPAASSSSGNYVSTPSSLSRSATMPVQDLTPSRSHSSRPQGESHYPEPPQRSQTVAHIGSSATPPPRKRERGHSIYTDPPRSSPTASTFVNNSRSGSSPPKPGHSTSNSTAYGTERVTDEPESVDVPYGSSSNRPPPTSSNLGRSATMPDMDPTSNRSYSAKPPARHTSSFAQPQPPQRSQTAVYAPSSTSSALNTASRNNTSANANYANSAYVEPPQRSPSFADSHGSSSNSDSSPSSRGHQRSSSRSRPPSSHSSLAPPSHSNSLPVYSSPPTTSSSHRRTSSRSRTLGTEYELSNRTSSHSHSSSSPSYASLSHPSSTPASSYAPSPSAHSHRDTHSSSGTPASSSRMHESYKPSTTSSSFSNPLPPPPTTRNLRAERSERSERSNAKDDRDRPLVRQGYWNSRGDHLTEDKQIVYVPNSDANPAELRRYPKPIEGFRNHLGIFLPYDPSWPELKMSPGRTYRSFIQYHQ